MNSKKKNPTKNPVHLFTYLRGEGAVCVCMCLWVCAHGGRLQAAQEHSLLLSLCKFAPLFTHATSVFPSGLYNRFLQPTLCQPLPLILLGALPSLPHSCHPCPIPAITGDLGHLQRTAQWLGGRIPWGWNPGCSGT